LTLIPAELYPRKIITALIAIRDELEPVPKDGSNAHFGYKYVTEQAMQAALRPLMKKHGILVIPSADPDCLPTTDAAGYYNYMAAFRICHEDGDVWPELVYVPAQDKGDKASWKANTGALKYFLNRLFMLDTGDDPEGKNDAAANDSRPPPQREAPPRQAPPQQAPSGGGASGPFMVKGQPALKKVYGAGFAASEAAHGPDKAMKFHSINASSKAMGYPRLEGVPVSEADELIRLIESYPQWWSSGVPPQVDDGGSGYDEEPPPF